MTCSDYFTISRLLYYSTCVELSNRRRHRKETEGRRLKKRTLRKKAH